MSNFVDLYLTIIGASKLGSSKIKNNLEDFSKTEESKILIHRFNLSMIFQAS